MKNWDYLQKTPFLCRQVLAAHYVRECQSVVEVGSCKSPISDFLAGPHDMVVCIDPLLPESAEHYDYKRNNRLVAKTLLYLQVPIESIDLYVLPGSFGLVALGYDIPGESLGNFSHLCRKADVVVMESWASYDRYLRALKYLIGVTTKEIALRIKIDLSDNDIGELDPDSWPPRFDRELVVLR